MLDLFVIGSLNNFDIISIIRLMLFIVCALLSLASLSDDFHRWLSGTFKGICYALQRYLVTNNILNNDGAHGKMMLTY